MQSNTATNYKETSESKLPNISIIIVTWNVSRTIAKVLKSIEMQNYPLKKIEILMVDGNSTDGSVSIAKKSKLNVRIIPTKHPNDPEACRSYGIHASKNEILAFVDADNYLPHKNWLRKIVFPLIVDKDIYGSQSLRYLYSRKDTLLNRYFSLLGSADPVGFYLKKDDRLSYLYDNWNLYGHVKHEYKDYFVIQFSPNHFPTLGCNAFFFRKSIVMKTKVTPNTFFHIDTPLDLAKKGFNKYAIVNDGIIHDTAGSFISFLSKRARYMRLHYLIRSNKRRYKVFDPSKREDIINLVKFSIYSLTFIETTYFAIKGFKKIHDPVWFVHPIFCFSIFWTYSFMVLLGFFQIQYSKIMGIDIKPR